MQAIVNPSGTPRLTCLFSDQSHIAQHIQVSITSEVPGWVIHPPANVPAPRPRPGYHAHLRYPFTLPPRYQNLASRAATDSPRGPEKEGKVLQYSHSSKGGRTQPPLLRPAAGSQSVSVTMKTGHTPASKARGSQIRRRALASAHEQCCSEPACHGLRRQLRRCPSHYGPLQSERGAAWLGSTGGSHPLVGSGRELGRARAGLGGLRQ